MTLSIMLMLFPFLPHYVYTQYQGQNFPAIFFPPYLCGAVKQKKRDILRSCQVKPMNLAFCYLSVTIFYYNSNYHNLNSASSLFVLQLNCTSQSALTAIHVLVQRRNDLPISFFVSYTVSTQWTTMTTIF